MACSNKEDQQGSNQSDSVNDVKKEVKEKIAIQSGIEARVTRQAALWPEDQLKILEGQDWAKAKTSFKLKPGAVVYVTDIGNEYVKVMTLIRYEGFIVKELLVPVSIIHYDSTKYFQKKRIGRINTFVDGFDVRTVKLWDNKTSRDIFVEQLINDEKVAILKEEGEYVKVATINGKEGWCMRGFIKK